MGECKVIVHFFDCIESKLRIDDNENDLYLGEFEDLSYVEKDDQYLN
jgi:hypothetical protein